MGILTRFDELDLPDVHHQRAKPYSALRPITAAAARVAVDDKREVERVKRRRQADTWQTDAWDYFDLIGEIKYAMNLIGNIMSRVRLYPAMVTGFNTIPSALDEVEGLPEGFATSAQTGLRKLESANGGIPGLLRDATINISVAGECYLVQTPAKSGSGLAETWEIKSVDELVSIGGTGAGAGFAIKPRRDAKAIDMIPVAKNAFVGRIWRTHPRYSDESDSSMRAMLDLMDELLLLSRTVRATARSRLNAGAVFVPDGLSVAGDMDGESEATVDDDGVMSPYTDDDSDSFEDELLNAMTTPISDEASAAAVVPLIIRGPAELADKIKVIKFERSFDPQLAQRADKALDRILNGLDIPKDAVTGMANVKYSNAAAIEDSLYKQHVEPLALMLCDALTVIFLRPVLRSLGFTEDLVSRAVIWYDPSAIASKPDHATAATTGYDKGIVSAEAWLRANGFSDTDAPSALEMMQRVARERGQLSEPITEALFKSLIPDLLQQVRQEAQASSPAPMTEDLQQALGNTGVSETPDASGLDGGSIPQPGAPGPDQAVGSPPPPVAPSAPGGLL